MQIEKYTDRLKALVQSAQSLALRNGHQQITPLHLLRALRATSLRGPTTPTKRVATLSPSQRMSSPPHWSRWSSGSSPEPAVRG